MQDLRAAIRSIARRPGFAVVAILTLALGIGGNAAIFSIIDRVLLQPLPYADANRLVMVWGYSPEVQQQTGFDRLPWSPFDTTELRARTQTLDTLAWIRSEKVNLTGTDTPERLNGARVSQDFFDALGVRAAVGRTFTDEDRTAARTVMISESLWARRFGQDAGISGRVISLGHQPATIVGVLPSWFAFPRGGDLPAGLNMTSPPDVWTLDVLTPQQQQNHGGKSFALIGHLRDGATVADAQGELDAIAADIAARFPGSNGGWTTRVMTLREQLVGAFQSPLVVLLVAVAFVLLIACANVANLMLVRAAGRQREMCVRLALGARRGRLVRLLLVESLVIALSAGVVGLFVAWAGLHGLRLFSPSSLAALDDAHLDWRVLGFTLIVSTATGLLFGVLPAFQAARSDLNEGLRDGARGTSGSRRAHRARSMLVVVEVALAMVLLVGAVLLLQTFVRLLRVDAGFNPDGVLTMEVALPRTTYPGPRAADFFDGLVERLQQVPGVQSVTAASGLPLTGIENLRQLTIDGQPPPAVGEEIVADYRAVTRDYFEVMGVPLRDGTLLPRDWREGTPPPVLINETLARIAWPDQSPIGRRLKLTRYDQPGAWHTVIGIVGDTHHTALDSSLRPQVYVHHRTDPTQQMYIALRAAGDPRGFATVARAAVLERDRDQPVGRIQTMTEIVADSVASRRFTMALAGVFAALAFALSLVGLYAVVSHSVAERTREMGLRVALGASPSSLLTLVLREGLSLVGLGIAAGFVAAFVMTRFMQTLLFGVEAHDMTTFVCVSLLLVVSSIVGCLVPARRAMRVDPMEALRAE